MARGAGTGLVFVLSAAVVAACEKSDSVVVVTVDADQGVSGVVGLRAIVSNADTGATRTFPATTPAAQQPITFPTTFSLTVPRDRTGPLDIALDGLDAGGAAIAAGAGSVELRVGDSAAVSIVLHEGASACGNGERDAGEDCDDGDRITNGSCDYLCRVRGAGPGTGGMGGGGGGTGGGGGAGGGACSIELLSNGNFDGASGWTASDPTGRPLIYDQTGLDPSLAPQAHSPPNMAWLGYNVVDAVVTLSQNLTVPANAVTLTVSGYRLIRTNEDTNQAYDRANLTLQNDATQQNLRPQPWSNLDSQNAWLSFSYPTDAAPFAGGTATFVISADMDNGVITSFFFDSLSVIADVCP